MPAFIAGMERSISLVSKLSDPRHYQIVVLSSLLAYGIVALDFGIHWQNAVAILTTALCVQWIAGRIVRLPRFDPLSPMITALSLTLLLRTDSVELAIIAATFAIGSKFVLRFRDKHIFNPANFALISMMLISDSAWVSSGQWGSAALGAFVLACLGFLVLTKAKRAETTIAFICFYSLLLFARAFWLGDPVSIPLHQMQNGALLIFAFFMISDPRTTPNTPVGRILYAALVAGVAFCIQFVFFEVNAPIVALIMCAPFVPLIDLLMAGQIYRWERSEVRSPRQLRGVS